ncbi:hypothetical protein [Candidatus Darwinibacter acetoxidans]
MEKLILGHIVNHKEIPRQLWVDPLDLRAAKNVAPVPAQVTFVTISSRWTGPFPHLEEVTDGVLTSSGWKEGMDRQGQPVHLSGESMAPAVKYDSSVNVMYYQNNGNGSDIEYRFSSPGEYGSLYKYMGLTLAPTYSSWIPEKRLMLKVRKSLVGVLENTLQLIDNWLGRVDFLNPREHFGSLEAYLDFMQQHKTYVGGGGYAACARFLKAQGYVPLQDVEI